MAGAIDKIIELIGDKADVLTYKCTAIKKEQLSLPGPDFIDRVVSKSDRPAAVLRNMQLIFNHGRLAGTGYVSVLPVDQGIEHSGGASFAPNPIYFDPDKICQLAHEGGCNAVASTLGVLASISRTSLHNASSIPSALAGRSDIALSSTHL